MDSSPPGSFVHGIPQARILEWVAISFSNACMHAKSLQLCPTLCDPHRWQPIRLPRPWDSLGKNTGVGCHFLLQCMKVKSESEVTQLYLTLSDPMDCSLPGSSIRGFSRQEYWSGVPLPSLIQVANDTQSHSQERAEGETCRNLS